MPLIDCGNNVFMHEVGVTFDEDHHNGKQDTLIIGQHQEIPQDWLDGLAEKRKATTDAGYRAGEFEEFAEIPMIFVEKWRKEGFDILAHNYKAEEIEKRLRAESLDAFLTTGRSI
jgi:hypothetical protein